MEKKILLALIMTLFTAGLIIASDSAVEFRTNLNEAKKEAGREGKLYIVEFMNQHCYPCKMMNEVTFANRHVVDYIEQNYIPVKINVESFDGFVWKEKYDIRVVPTIMVFNSEGKILAKYEESIGSRRMHDILIEHNNPNNRTGVMPSILPAPAIPPSHSPTKSTPYSNPLPIYSPPSPSPSAPQPHPNKEIDNATGLFEFTVKRADSRGYGVQVGVYAEYGNVLRAVERLERQYSRQILVNINVLNGRTVYKVIVGGFSSYSNANDFKRQISRNGTDYFIVDLAQF